MLYLFYLFFIGILAVPHEKNPKYCSGCFQILKYFKKGRDIWRHIIQQLLNLYLPKNFLWIFGKTTDEAEILYLIGRKSRKTRWDYERMKEICKRIRQNYDPRKRNKDIKVLFIRESLPEDDTFFYCEIRSCIMQLGKPSKELNKEIPNFLRCFKYLGCYLIDIFDELGKRIDSSCQEFKDQINGLARNIKDINPRFIIVVHERVCYCVKLALSQAKLNIDFRCLPFPQITQRGVQKNTNNYSAYTYQLAEIIKEELIPRKIISKRLSLS